jgi:hypothetical protein
MGYAGWDVPACARHLIHPCFAAFPVELFQFLQVLFANFVYNVGLQPYQFFAQDIR